MMFIRCRRCCCCCLHCFHFAFLIRSYSPAHYFCLLLRKDSGRRLLNFCVREEKATTLCALIAPLLPVLRLLCPPTGCLHASSPQAYFTCITQLLALRQGDGASPADLALLPPSAAARSGRKNVASSEIGSASGVSNGNGSGGGSGRDGGGDGGGSCDYVSVAEQDAMRGGGGSDPSSDFGFRSWGDIGEDGCVRPLYVCGDSHTLPMAWCVIHAPQLDARSAKSPPGAAERAKATPRKPAPKMAAVADDVVAIAVAPAPSPLLCRYLLTPALVTGLKHWHLRPANDFYPKAQFYAVTGAIPRGAAVIFVFGEIDCREGLLVAVERGRYDSLEQAAAETVRLFVDAALTLVRERGFVAFVHPVVPVLNETRRIVTLYNHVLRAQVEAVAPELQWLEFFEGMLTADRKQLRPEIALDGTHLSPAYQTLLETALRRCTAC
ncbi:unnamed protein product, partial [Phaeothamnion confervicola]